MIDISKIDYSFLDRPEILMFLFHPRPEYGSRAGEAAGEVLIPVEADVVVGGRFYISGKDAPNILFFHGNGEIVADYEDIAPLYTRLGLNFMPVDYRGYGRSTGRPTITAMIRDSHVIFDYVQNYLHEKSHTGPLIVMGRSLGSASALELISCYDTQINGLIIESGFAYAEPLLTLLGIDIKAMNIQEEDGFRNIDKIRTFPKTTLIIHAEKDHIIPFSDGQALYDACPSQDKRLLKIPKANHNDIFLRGMSEYMEAIKELAEKIK
ncbi:MAG: alpha/beta hydrolase [FCB group bacterium]|nr:alpha/beta hydrolase [FCB group bacterium]